MAAYTQANRPMRVDTGLGEDVLLLSGFNGHEGVSQLFGFQLDMLSLDAEIDPAKLLREPVTVSMNLPGGEKRLVHGLMSRLTQLGKQDDLMSYRAEIVPWLWFLRLMRGSRMFQEISVPDILEKVFSDAGFSDFEFRLTRSYAPRLYCVQYRETHFDFVSRLMEEEGIYYFFEHTRDKHVLVLCDDNGSTHPAPAAETARFTADASRGEEVITDLEREHSVHTGKITVRDYDYLQPSLNLEASLGDDKFELYDYPGSYADKEGGERVAELLLEAEEAERQVLRGKGNVRGLIAGYHFTLKEHFRRDANAKYLVTQIQHSASAGGFRAQEQNSPLEYQNEFFAIPYGTPFRTPRRTPRPLIHGSQSALVVGPAGEEIHVDKHGRVKVHFYWDRDSKRDEHSSCWIRVTTPWGGKGWGFIHIPRIGQEVIVDFLEGDPDRPIITGRVYNAEQVPPYDLPANQTQSGVKSRSSKGGGTDNFNEIRLEDLKGSEQIYIHAEKDRQMVVENNNDESIGSNESITVGADQTVNIGKNRTETVGEDETISIAGDRTETVDKDEKITISGGRTESVGKNETIDIAGERKESVSKDEKVSIGGERSVKIAKADALDVGKKLTITAADQIILKTGDATLTMKKDGTITLKGKNITLQGSGKINVKADQDVTIKGTQVKTN